MKKYASLMLGSGLFITLILCGSAKKDPGFNPGKERWIVKTNVLRFTPVKEFSINELLDLPNPILGYSGQVRSDYQAQRFPAQVGPRKVREGDIVRTSGHILLAAVEKDKNGEDGDIHVQIRVSSEWGDTCLIVEATYPPFILGNQRLQDSCKKVRAFFEDEILRGKKYVCFGTPGKQAPSVQVTGQLFFDAHHMGTGFRGKSNKDTKEEMHSYTCWEIHPIISISYSKK